MVPTFPAISPLAVGDHCKTYNLERMGACKGLVWFESDTQIYISFLLPLQRELNFFLTMHWDFQISLKTVWERLNLALSPVHESSIILLLSMSGSWLFTLTLATSNLYSGLILAFQIDWFGPYHAVREVFVVSPRAVIECGCTAPWTGVLAIH